MMIAQLAKHVNRSSKILHRVDRVSKEAIGHAEQVKRFSHAQGILLRFKQMERLLMRFKSLLNSTCIHQPVAQPIEAACSQRGISKPLGQVASTAEPSSCLFVITSRPEEAECHHALPFHQAVMSGTSCLQCVCIIAQRAFKLAKCFMGLSAQAIN